MNSALITVDVQEGFHDLYWGNRNNPKCEENIERILSYWRKKGWPIFHVLHASKEKSSPLRSDQKGFRFMDFLKVRPNEQVITKDVNSAFIGTNLEHELKRVQIQSIVFVGFTTDHCVSTSCRMAANLDFRCSIVSDATATFDRRLPNETEYPADLVHQVSLASLSGEFAEVISTRSVLKLWNKNEMARAGVIHRVE